MYKQKIDLKMWRKPAVLTTVPQKCPLKFLSTNRYDHIAMDGAARDGGSAVQGRELSGAFLFPPAQPGAFRFQFVDADQGVVIPNIELRPPAL